MRSHTHKAPAYLIDEFRGKSQQIKQGFSLCGSAFGMVTLALLFTYFYEEELKDYLEIPLRDHLAYLSASVLVLCLVNPLMEEWFWYAFAHFIGGESSLLRPTANENPTEC